MFKLVHIALRGDKWIVATEQYFPRAYGISGDPVDVGPVKKWAGGAVIPDAGESLFYIRHQFIEGQTATPVGKNNLEPGIRNREVEAPPWAGASFAGIKTAYGLAQVDKQRNIVSYCNIRKRTQPL